MTRAPAAPDSSKPEEAAPLDDESSGMPESAPPVVPPQAEPAEPAAPGVDEAAARCRPPAGVSGSPRNLSQLAELLNALPRPTTLPCFLSSLDRPLEVYLTSSIASAQPADGERSPRTFIVLGPLFLSIVPSGEFSSLLEIGLRTGPERSIKSEIEFPLRSRVTGDTLQRRIEMGEISTCGGCHVAEQLVSDDFIGAGAFESAVIAPFSVGEVPLDELRAQLESCDGEVEPSRCEMLEALFDHGDVIPSGVWSE